MTAGLRTREMEVLGEGARETRPAVSIVWALGKDRHLPSAWLDVYDGPGGRSAVFALAGALGRTSLQRFEEALTQTFGWGVRRVIIDFSRVTHLNYRQLPHIVAMLRARAEEGLAYAFVGLNRYLSDLFRVAGVDLDSESPAGDFAVCGAASSQAVLHGTAAGGLGRIERRGRAESGLE